MEGFSLISVDLPLSAFRASKEMLRVLDSSAPTPSHPTLPPWVAFVQGFLQFECAMIVQILC